MLSLNIAIVLAFQAHRTPFFNVLFRALSSLGEEFFVVATVPLAFVLVRPVLAARFAFSLLATGWIVEVLKMWIRMPRPEAYVPGIALDPASGFGFPSGHATFSMVFWRLLAVSVTSRSWKWVTAMIILGVGLSRIYLGVHFPIQVVAGWILGGGILFFSAKGFVPFAQELETFPVALRVALTVFLPPALLLLGVSPQIVSVLAAGQGAAAGLGLRKSFLAYPESLAEGTPNQKTKRAMLVLFVTLVVYVVLKTLGDFPEWSEVSRWLRYLILGFVVTWLGPCLCEWTSLLNPKGPALENKP